MIRQRSHRRRFPLRKDGTRKRGTYSAGRGCPKVLKSKPRVFVSHHSKDDYAKKLLQAQAKNRNMSMEFSDQSLNKPFKSKWKTRTKPKIRKASTTVVMIGKDTHKRKAVQWEIEQSRKTGNKVIGVRIHKDKKHKIPKGIKKQEVTNWKVDKVSTKIRQRKRK
ncbi:TIR domain-containing protein [Nanoarchaeota archaeon]